VILGQIPSLLGIQGINASDPPYLIVYQFSQRLSETKLDIVFGLSSVILLLLLSHLADKYGKTNTAAKWISVGKNAAVVSLFTFISYLLNRHYEEPLISVIKGVPSGLHYIQPPDIPNFKTVLSASITVVIVGTIEHMAIAKYLGRQNGYSAVAKQELVAMGVGNIFGSFFGAFPATGSFSRSAISSQCGSKSPLSTFITSLVVLSAIFFLMPLLYYVPQSVLSAIIMVAMMHLIAKPFLIRQMAQTDGMFLMSARGP
jgi:sodium-independent sulfate anion transporter 11